MPLRSLIQNQRRRSFNLLEIQAIVSRIRGPQLMYLGLPNYYACLKHSSLNVQTTSLPFLLRALSLRVLSYTLWIQQ